MRKKTAKKSDAFSNSIFEPNLVSTLFELETWHSKGTNFSLLSTICENLKKISWVVSEKISEQNDTLKIRKLSISRTGSDVIIRKINLIFLDQHIPTLKISCKFVQAFWRNRVTKKIIYNIRKRNRRITIRSSVETQWSAVKTNYVPSIDRKPRRWRSRLEVRLGDSHVNGCPKSSKCGTLMNPHSSVAMSTE